MITITYETDNDVIDTLELSRVLEMYLHNYAQVNEMPVTDVVARIIQYTIMLGPNVTNRVLKTGDDCASGCDTGYLGD